MSVGLEGAIAGTLQHTVVPLKLDRLPEEVLQQIFAMVSPNDLQVATLVNRSIKNSVIAAVNLNERASIKKFIEFLILGLNAETFQNQRNMLGEISREITRENFLNLRLLKGYILDVKAQLINVIKTLEEDTITGLKSSLPPPHFFEDIFVLSEFERQIDAAKLIPDEGEKMSVLWDISKKLEYIGNLNRAVDVAQLVSDKESRSYLLFEISVSLIKAGNIDRAIEVLRWSPDEMVRGNNLNDISKILIKAGNLEKAIDAAKLIPDNYQRWFAFSHTSQALAQAGNSNRAIAVVRLISHKHLRITGLRNISEALTKRGDIERAAAVLELISKE